MTRTPFFIRWLYPGLIWTIPTNEKALYLTFDDGPIPGPTEFVLDQLAKHEAKATFFCIGDNVRKHPDIYTKVLRAGHRVGNHTFNHTKGWNCSVSEYLNNTMLCDQELKKGGGLESAVLFRPPYGRIKRSQIRALHDRRIIMWDVLTWDYSRRTKPEGCLRNTINGCRPGSIVVFHDSLKAQKNMEYALPRLLDHFKGEGYSFKSIPIH